jgi:hypothetical protein
MQQHHQTAMPLSWRETEHHWNTRGISQDYKVPQKMIHYYEQHRHLFLTPFHTGCSTQWVTACYGSCSRFYSC